MKNVRWCLILLIFVGMVCSCNKRGSVASDEKVQRVVALSPAAGEILFAVGAGEQVAAVSQFTDYPPEAAALPQVGGFDGKTLSMESILGFKPDLVYMSDVMHNFMIPQLESYGIKYYLSKADSVDGVMKEITEIGELTGHGEQARAVVEGMKAQIDDATRIAKGNGDGAASSACKIYWEVWNSPFMSAGSSSFINDVICYAGGKNIFDDLQDAYPIVSEEAIIKRLPDVILLPASSGVSVADVCARAGWEDISAVTNGRIYIVDDNVYTRPGPRVAQVIKQLAGIIGE